MFENQDFLILLVLILIIVLVWILTSILTISSTLSSAITKYESQSKNNVSENFSDITYNTNYNLQPGELIVAHSSDKGTTKYYAIPTTPTMDYGYFKQKIDNHEYKFIMVPDPTDPANKMLNVLPKLDLITGIPEYISTNSEEYNLVNNLRHYPEKYRLLYSENNIDSLPYSITRKPCQLMQPIRDIFLHTSH